MASTDGENTLGPNASCSPSPASISSWSGRCQNQFEYIPRLKPLTSSSITLIVTVPAIANIPELVV